MLLLAVSTFLSEDLTCVAAGILAGSGDLAWPTALIGCYVGIVFGDGLLWLLGHQLGRRALKLPVVRSLVPPEKVARAERWFADNGMKVILISRCLPGSRFATYLCAGILGSRAKHFLLLATVAAAVWTPLVVWASARFQEAVKQAFSHIEANPWLTVLVSLTVLVGSIHLVGLLSSRRERAYFRAKWARRMRWEFLPLWLLELPVVLYAAWLALRTRGLRNPLVVNPGIYMSGFVGERKSEILAVLDDPDGALAKTLDLRGRASVEERLAATQAWMDHEGLGFPLIVKPDVGQRGSGVQKVRTEDELEAALAPRGFDPVVQEFVDLPFEAGVFYVREADAAHGRVRSITLKEFPTVTGDGESSLEELVLAHPRQRLWAHMFIHRLGDKVVSVPARGEIVSLGIAGNHAQGTTFRDGTPLVTPELEAWTDAMAHAVRGGFHLGRFDVRAPSRASFLRGEGLRVLELNGVTGEATHVYDPDRSLGSAWRDLGAQWRAAFRIGRALRQAGTQPPAYSEFFRAAWRSWRQSRHHPPSGWSAGPAPDTRQDGAGLD